MPTKDFIADQVLIALRRITRTIDLHSRRLMQSFGLTVPQLLAMHELERAAEATASELSQRLNLSGATVAGIAGRLERRGFVERRRCEVDRRRVLLFLSAEGRRVLLTAPSLLQQAFVEKFAGLADWEQHLLLSSLQRLVCLMEAEEIEAAPLLSPDAADAEAPTLVAPTEIAEILGLDPGSYPGRAEDPSRKDS